MSSTIPSAVHGLDANLATYPLPEVEALLNDGTVSALNAANQINDLPEAQAAGVKTSKTSVRRHRRVHGIEAEAKRVAKRTMQSWTSWPTRRRPELYPLSRYSRSLPGPPVTSWRTARARSGRRRA